LIVRSKAYELKLNVKSLEGQETMEPDNPTVDVWAMIQRAAGRPLDERVPPELEFSGFAEEFVIAPSQFGMDDADYMPAMPRSSSNQPIAQPTPGPDVYGLIRKAAGHSSEDISRPSALELSGFTADFPSISWSAVQPKPQASTSTQPSCENPHSSSRLDELEVQLRTASRSLLEGQQALMRAFDLMRELKASAKYDE